MGHTLTKVRAVGERVTFTHASVFYRIRLLRFLERPADLWDGWKEKKEKTITSQSSKHSIVLDSLLLNRRQAMRHGKGGEREERRERKERGGEEGEKKGLENPLGVTGVL